MYDYLIIAHWCQALLIGIWTRWCQAPLRKHYNITKILRAILDATVLHLHPVFADVFPIFGKSHSRNQLLFGKSGGLLSDMIDRFHAVAASLLRCGTVFGFPTVDNMTFPAA